MLNYILLSYIYLIVVLGDIIYLVLICFIVKSLLEIFVILINKV